MKTTVVGSYPVPDWLKAAPGEQALEDAMSIVLRAHELAGIDVICDGELGRWDLQRNAPGGMVERFVRRMSGIQPGLTREQREHFESREDTRYRRNAPAMVISELGEGDLDLVRDWRQVRELSEAPIKFTLTSPYMMAKVVADDHYRDLERLSLAFADVLAWQVAAIDCAVLQVDEPNLPGSPEDSPLAAKAINRVLDAASAADETAVHLCFGNYGGQTIQSGHYEELIGFLNALHCDHLVLETIRRPIEETERIREIDERIKLGLGVIDVKDLQVESPELVASRIESFAKLFGEDRFTYVHPDCGLQHLPRATANGKMRALVAGRNLFLGQSR